MYLLLLIVGLFLARHMSLTEPAIWHNPLSTRVIVHPKRNVLHG